MFTADRMQRWMTARGQRYVVLRAADVLPLRDEARRALAAFARVDEGDKPTAAWHEAARPCEGYVCIPIDRVASLPQPDLVRLQGALAEYVDGRRSRGTPVRRDSCAACRGKGCPQCGQRGYTDTLLELDDDESRLAEQGGADHGT